MKEYKANPAMHQSSNKSLPSYTKKTKQNKTESNKHQTRD